MAGILQVGQTRADQNTGGALLEFPLTTAMHGKSRVSSAISVYDNLKKYSKLVSRQWRLGVGVVITGWCKLKVRARWRFLPNFFQQ